jgi:hypothetical protein
MKFALMIPNKLENAENRNDLTASQNETAFNKSIAKSKSGLLVYSASELLSTFDGKETDFLWDNLIPRVGTGLLVGQPDLGKSQLAKELAIMIAKGSSEHLGMKLKPTHNHVLYVFTEDQEEGVSSSLHKQLIKHSDLDKSRLSLAFLRDETIAELIKKLDAFCALTPVDLVVIDAFGDIFSGSDSNNNIQMRRDIKAFDDIVRKHKISVLFVHHINKSGYGKNPSQEIIQGGSGLTQKVRYALFLSRNNDGQKFLNVAKGNYSSSFYKDNRLPVDFDEETLTFEVNGEWEPISGNQEKTKKDLSETDLFLMMKNAGMPYTVLVSKIIGTLATSKSTAERRIGKLVIAGKLTKVGDLYFRSEVIQNDKLGTTLKLESPEKNEGEGNVISLGKVEDLNISTLNLQTPVHFEGDGKENDTEIADGIFPPTLFKDAVEIENEEQSTLNPQYSLGNEGEGNFNDKSQEGGLTDLDDIINFDNDTYRVVDPIILQLNDIVGDTPFYEDENYFHAVQDFYITGLAEVKKSPIQYDTLKWILMDQYCLTEIQAEVLLDIFIELNKIKVNEDGEIDIV